MNAEIAQQDLDPNGGNDASEESSSLLDECLEMLANRGPKVSLESIALGADVSVWWLRRVNLRTITDPGIKKVEKLHRYLVRQRDCATA